MVETRWWIFNERLKGLFDLKSVQIRQLSRIKKRNAEINKHCTNI